MRLVPATKNGPKRRPARSHRRRPIAAEQLESRAMLAGLSIDGGLSWNGWTSRGLSDQGDLYGSGGVTNAELYDADKGDSHQIWARCRRSGAVRGTFAGSGSAERCGS
jgi:hypothetical protein